MPTPRKIAMLCLLLTAAAGAQAGQGLSLPEALATAFANNPQLAAAGRESAIADGERFRRAQPLRRTELGQRRKLRLTPQNGLAHRACQCRAVAPCALIVRTSVRAPGLSRTRSS